MLGTPMRMCERDIWPTMSRNDVEVAVHWRGRPTTASPVVTTTITAPAALLGHDLDHGLPRRGIGSACSQSLVVTAS